MRRRRLDEIERKEWIVAVVTGLAGIVNGGVLITLADARLLDNGAFWELYVVSGLVGIAIFPPLVIRLTNVMSDSVIAVTSTSDGLASFMADLVNEFGLASVTAPLGIGIGIGLWFVFGVFLIPGALTVLGTPGPLSFPHLGWGMFVGYFFYGFSLGGFFGLVIPELQRRQIAPEELATT